MVIEWSFGSDDINYSSIILSSCFMACFLFSSRDVQILTFHKIFESRYLKSIRTNVIAVFRLIKGLPREIIENDNPYPGPVVRKDMPDYFYIYNISLNSNYILKW
jgi:hypothetical protein